MLNFSVAQFRYEPYPLGVLRPALDSGLYQELVASFPPVELFGKIPQYDYKLSLSEKFNGPIYEKFIRESPPWRRFHGWLKSSDFIRETVNCLKQNYIDLDLDSCFDSRVRRATKLLLQGRKLILPP